MYRLFIVAFSFFILLGHQTVFSQVKNQKLGAQSFSGEIMINSSPEKVWNVMTDAKQFSSILGYEYAGGTKKFSRAGDAAAVKFWGDVGSLMLVRAIPQKELRFNADPENGSYICNCRWTLTQSGQKTKVWFEERYTESGPQTKEVLDGQVKEHNKMLAKLKSAIEN